MASSADDLNEFKLTEEEEKETVIEWNDVAEAVGYLEELKNFYRNKSIALGAVKLAQGKFANAHLWANKVRIIAKALEKKAESISKELTAVDKKAIRITKVVEDALYKQVTLAQELYSSIESNQLDKAEAQRLKLIKFAIIIGKFIRVLRLIETQEKTIEKHYF